MKTMRAMDSNKKKVMDRRVKEHQKVFRPRNKDVNAMKAMIPLRALIKEAKKELDAKKVLRPSNKDANAMKAMKVTMKAMKRRVSRPELHKALIRDIKWTLLKTNTVCKARKAQGLATKIFGALRWKPPDTNPPKEKGVFWKCWNMQYPSDGKKHKLIGLWIDLKNKSVNEKWHRK